MTRLSFVVPVHGRQALTRVCLRQLARTCEAAAGYGIDATAVVIGDDASVDYADELGFATVRRDNQALGRKFNDGYQLACDPDYNPEPADYAVPCGSDDWIDPVILRRLPPPDTVGIFRKIAVVDEDRTQLMCLTVGYKTAAGPKIIPRDLLALTGYRPSEEDRRRAIDASTMEGIKRRLGRWPNAVEMDVHPLQIVDWKSHGDQLNSFRMLRGFRRGDITTDPFAALAEFYPAEALGEMRELSLVVA